MVDKTVVPDPVITKSTVETSPQLKKETVEEGDYKVEILRDYYGQVDPFYLDKKDPKYHYRFLRDDTQSGSKNISIKTSNLLLQAGGWQLCPHKHLLTLGITERELSPDGFLRRGDTILAFIPKGLYEEKEKHKIRVNKERAKAREKRLEKGDATSEGVRPHPTMRGLETKDKLGGFN